MSAKRVRGGPMRRSEAGRNQSHVNSCTLRTHVCVCEQQVQVAVENSDVGCARAACRLSCKLAGAHTRA